MVNPMSKPQILAVDDEEINLNVIALALEDHYEVLFASSGEDCLKKLNDIKPDLILLDLVMPGLSGHDVCKTLQSQESTSSIPIIFVTSAEETSNRIKAYSNGAHGYVLKPIDADNLLDKVSSALVN